MAKPRTYIKQPLSSNLCAYIHSKPFVIIMKFTTHMPLHEWASEQVSEQVSVCDWLSDWLSEWVS